MAAKTIDITTTQNVTIEYELARLRDRALAWIIDVILIGVSYLVIIRLLLPLLERLISDDEWGWLVMVFLFPFLLLFIYNILFEILNNGQSLGKRAIGIKVVRLDGKSPEWADVLLRAVMLLVDIVFSAGVIGSLLVKTTAKSQRLGDIAAHTTVIRIQGNHFQFQLKDILGISTLDTYQPQYPQVKNLSEKDMIYIKTVLTRLQKYPNDAHEELLEDVVTKLMPKLQIEVRPMDRKEFVKTILRDFIVLTR
ncbi:MAG: RDD family protein [Saprospiraceae bacterium]